MKRTPLKRKTPLRRKNSLRRVSRKRRGEMDEYHTKRKVFLEAYPVCGVCRHAQATQVHHKKGRGKFYLRVDSWLATCGACHEAIHKYPKWARNEGLIQDRDYSSSSGQSGNESSA